MIPIHPRALVCWPWLPALLPAGAVVVGPGVVLLVREDGGCDPWPPFQNKSIASDPTATARRPGSARRAAP